MNFVDKIFLKYTPDFNKLIKYGFVLDKDIYRFEKVLKSEEFKAVVEISKTGKLSGKIYDLETNDEFLPLKLDNQAGSFIGQVKEDYLELLNDLKEQCFTENFFVSNQANRIAAMIIKKYNDTPRFMWEKFPDCGVFKNPLTGKWYGLVANINLYKLDKTKKDIYADIMNVKLDETNIKILLNKKGFYPAWHMNKKTWITIVLDETISDNEIFKLIDESYSYTIK